MESPFKLSPRRKTQVIAAIVSIMLCVSLLGGAVYIAYLDTYHASVNALRVDAEHIRLKLNQMFESFETTLERMSKLNKSCTLPTQKKLQQIVLNQPEISLAYIETKDSFCSNLSNTNPKLKLAGNENLSIHGPIKLKYFLSPTFIISLKLGDVSYGLILTEQVLLRVINENRKDHTFAALMQLPKKHLHLSAGEYAHPLADNLADKGLHINDNFADNNKRLYMSFRLHHFNDIYFIAGLTTPWLWQSLWLHIVYFSLIAAVLLLISLYFVYLFTKRRLSLKNELLEALKSDEFIAHYQPVIDAKTKAIIGVECLIRWQPQEGGLIFPDLFIPAAEETGLIKPITEKLIQKIFNEMGELLTSNPDFHIAINLSPQHFDDNQIFDTCKQLCTDHSVNCDQIIFELTENELFREDSDEAIAIMNNMRKEGFSLALDDFGTGYSSIHYLSRFPFDYIKIDRHYVIAIGTGAITEGLADSIIKLAKANNFKIIAEGIEDLEHEEYLKERGVQFLQGWLYSKALSIDDFLAFHQKYKQ